MHRACYRINHASLFNTSHGCAQLFAEHLGSSIDLADLWPALVLSTSPCPYSLPETLQCISSSVLVHGSSGQLVHTEQQGQQQGQQHH
jgi:hypothetical protein